MANPRCANGHEQPVTGTKFCIYCGSPVLAAEGAQHSASGQAPASQGPTNTQSGPAAPVDQHLRPPTVQHQPPVSPNPHSYPQQPQYSPVIAHPQPEPQRPICATCGGAGAGLEQSKVICRECRWLRPLVPGYQVDSSAFAWAADAKAMAVLRSMKPLNAAAKAVSEKVGRRWVEVTFNGVRLGEKQMPHVYGQAVRAARVLGMHRMPDVYLSGERPWDMLTFGSEKDSFIVVGSALAGNFQGVDMFFLLARELGHCKAGHALWKTVIRFFLGEQGPQKGVMAGGIFNAILSPSALIGGAIELPLLAWARQAEITADRAGLLAVGKEEIARRVLMAWSLKSSFIYGQLNMVAWIEQQSVDDGDMLRLSELTTTSTPYLGPRLKLLSQYAKSPELQGYLRTIGKTIKRSAPPKPKPAEGSNDLRLKCSSCSAPMKIPMSVLEGKTQLSVKCPSASCGKTSLIKKNVKQAGSAERTLQRKENQNYAE